MTKIRLAGTVGDSITDGPGIRYTIFVQGCPHNCPGCHNPQTHDFGGGKDVDIDDLLEEGMRNPLLCGVTFSGGEPMCQAKVDGAKELLEQLDTLVDGPFIQARRTWEAKFMGSDNQRVIDVQRTLKEGKVVLDESERWN